MATRRRSRPTRKRPSLDFVESGKGVVALHSASDMFGGSERYTTLIGAQSQRQGAPSEFTAEIVQSSHPAVQGVQPFATWDETVTFTKQNATDRTVLMERVDGTGRTPWTWVRNQGKGRVFYTAYGHDQRTWNNPAFQTLVERAVVWSVPEAGASGVPAAQDAAGQLRRRHERAELREPRSGAQVPVALRSRTRR